MVICFLFFSQIELQGCSEPSDTFAEMYYMRPTIFVLVVCYCVKSGIGENFQGREYVSLNYDLKRQSLIIEMRRIIINCVL